MSRRPLGLLAMGPLVILSLFVACDGLKRADEPADAGGADGGGDEQTVEEDGGGVQDGALGDSTPPDAGTPPVDFECPGDPWTKVAKTKPECAPRQVKVISAIAPLDVASISIARTPAGRVGIVYNSEQGSDEGELHLVHFTPTTAAFAAPKLVKRATGLGLHDGYITRLTASAPDTLAVLGYDRDDTDLGEVHLRKLVAGAEPLTDDLLVTAVKHPTELAVASDPAGNIYATVRISTGVNVSKLSTWKKLAAGPFVPLVPEPLTGSLMPSQTPGVGSVSLFVDLGGQVHLLYPFNDGAIEPQHSIPRYHTLAATTWSARKTVDNGIIDGLSGYSPRIVVFGTKKYAAYFFRKAAQAVPQTADLRLATWDAALDTPQIEILDQQIPSPEPVLYPAYQVAMAIDKYGLVHLAIIRPSSSGTLALGVLEYRRQIRVTGGGTKWLEDIVDPDVISDGTSAYVDLVVDENARPHIAYRSAKDGHVKYATRFDR